MQERRKQGLTDKEGHGTFVSLGLSYLSHYDLF